MTLISICTILCVLIFFMGTNRQQVVECPVDGFSGEWKFKVDKNIVILFAIVLICVSTMRYGWIDTYAYKEMYLSSRGNLVYVNSATIWRRSWLALFLLFFKFLFS